MTTAKEIYSTNDLELFETHRKSRATAYAAYFMTGAVGGHRHYLGYGGTGFLQTLLGLTLAISVILVWPYIQEWFATPETILVADDQGLTWFITAAGSLLLLGLWLVVDMFRIPALAAKKNRALISRLAAPAKVPTCPTDVIARFATLRANGTISEEEFVACKQHIMGITPSPVPPPANENRDG